MNAFLTQTMARSFAQMIIDTAAPRLMRAIVCAALIVSVSEAAAQLRTRDTSANAIFHGCKALGRPDDKRAIVRSRKLLRRHRHWACLRRPTHFASRMAILRSSDLRRPTRRGSMSQP